MYCSLFNGTHSGNNSSAFHYIIALIDSPCPQCPMSNWNMFLNFYLLLFLLELLHIHVSLDANVNSGNVTCLVFDFEVRKSRGRAEMKVKREQNGAQGGDRGQWEDQRKEGVDTVQRHTVVTGGDASFHLEETNRQGCI